MKQFDIRSLRKADVRLVRKMYEGDVWMQSEMVNRHKGIAKESNFALAMFRWVNTVMEYMEVVERMDKIGIVEIDAKVSNLKMLQSSLQSLLDMRRKKSPHMMFKELRTKIKEK